MKTKRTSIAARLALWAAALILPLGLSAQVNTTGFDHLKLPSGGRFAGMGEATTGLVDDVEALNINIGGLSRLKNLQIFVEGQIWVQDVKFGGVSVAAPLKFFVPSKIVPGVVGIGFQYFGVTPFDVYSDWGVAAADQATFGASRFKLGYSLQLLKTDRMLLNAGLSAAIVTRSLDAASRTTADAGKLKPAVDAGLLATINHGSAALKNIMGDSFNVGLVMNNIDFINTGAHDNQPTSLRLGLGATFLKSLNLGIDVLKTWDRGLQANLGAEYWLKDIVALRIGGKLGKDQSGFFSAGVGARYKIGQYVAHVDYAFVPMGEFGPTHKVSLKFDIAKIEVKTSDKTDIYYYKGVDFFLHNQYSEAIEMWQKVLARNPGHADAKKRIEEARKLQKLEDQQKGLKKLEDGFKQNQEKSGTDSGSSQNADSPGPSGTDQQKEPAKK